jgi:ssDNA-binding replication factor A large subunit
VYLADLFGALVSAKKNSEAICGKLLVEYRGTFSNQAVFLITKASQVVVQFRVEEDFLLRENIAFERWMDTDKVRNQIAKQNLSTKTQIRVEDLRHGMKKVDIEVQMVEMSKPISVRTRYGNNVLLANTWVADKTGKIKLCLWGDQVSSVCVDDMLQLKNASVYSYKGELQLRLGKTGEIIVLPTVSQKPKNVERARK